MKKVILLSASMLLLSASAFAVGKVTELSRAEIDARLQEFKIIWYGPMIPCVNLTYKQSMLSWWATGASAAVPFDVTPCVDPTTNQATISAVMVNGLPVFSCGFTTTQSAQ